MVGVVFDKSDMRIRAGKHFAREFRRDFQDTVDFAVSQIAQSIGFITVINRREGLGIHGHGLKHFVQLDCWYGMVLIHDAHLEVFYFSTKRVAQHDELDDRHDHGDEHERRAASEAAQIAFNDGPDPMHVTFPRPAS